MTIEELEETYRQLHERLLRGEMDEASFKAQVEQLRFEDAQGNRWKLGWYTGQWYRYEQGQWVQGKPGPQPPAGISAEKRPPAKEDKARRPAASWLAVLLIGLLALAAIALAIGWQEGWWAGPAGGEIGAASTTPPTATTPAPSPTSVTPTAPLPSPTAMARPTRAASPTTAPSATASPTITSSPMPTATSSTAAVPSPAAAPALSGQIFFPRYDPGRQTFDIYVFRLNSDEPERRVVEQASQPALSPNGARLAYRSWNRAHRSLRVQELADGHTWTWINVAEAARPSWSPDSQNIVFPSQQEPDRQWRIYRSLGLDSDHVRRHGGDILGRVPAWLADGRIAYWECPLNKCGLYVMQSDGTLPTQLTTWEHDTAPAGSPDGSQIAFMSNKDGNWEIYVTTTHPHGELTALRLTENQARDGLPTWSPDGRWLAFVSDRSGSWAVWVTRPDGSDQHKLFDLGGPLEGEISRVAPEDQHGWTWESIAWGP